MPARRADSLIAEAKAAGVDLLATLPEDRLLATPVLRDVVEALSAQTEHFDGGGLRPLDRPVIAPISADPGQGYFAGYGASAVIVRSDKPDLQLAALNASAGCLILTGGLPILSYVLERAEEDQVPHRPPGGDHRDGQPPREWPTSTTSSSDPSSASTTTSQSEGAHRVLPRPRVPSGRERKPEVDELREIAAEQLPTFG